MTDAIIKPGVTFFFTGVGDADDNEIDVTSFGIEPLLSYEEALASAEEDVRDHGSAIYVLEAKVSARVSRGRIRVKRYGDRK